MKDRDFSEWLEICFENRGARGLTMKMLFDNGSNGIVLEMKNARGVLAGDRLGDNLVEELDSGGSIGDSAVLGHDAPEGRLGDTEDVIPRN